MAKPNYAFEKRQREMEAKRKKADKAARKVRPSDEPATEQPTAPAAPVRVESGSDVGGT